MNIAKKNDSKLPLYKTILGHGPGTQQSGSHANKAPTSSTNGNTMLGIGSAAGSGVVISSQRHSSVGKHSKNKALQAHNLFV